IALFVDSPAAVTLEDPAHQVGRERLLAGLRRSAERQFLPTAQGREVATGEPEIEVDRAPPETRQFLPQRLLGRRARHRARERLCRGELQARAVAIDLPLEREESFVAVAVSELFLQELGAQVLYQLVPVLARLPTAQPGVAERAGELPH